LLVFILSISKRDFMVMRLIVIWCTQVRGRYLCDIEMPLRSGPEEVPWSKNDRGKNAARGHPHRDKAKRFDKLHATVGDVSELRTMPWSVCSGIARRVRHFQHHRTFFRRGKIITSETQKMREGSTSVPSYSRCR
jgi:hypothetical protein